MSQPHELAPLNRRGTAASRERRSNKRLRRARDWRYQKEREQRRARGPLTVHVQNGGVVQEVSLMAYVFAAMGFAGRASSSPQERRAPHPAD